MRKSKKIKTCWSIRRQYVKVYIFKTCEFDGIIYWTVTEDIASSAVLSSTLLWDWALHREKRFLHRDTRWTTLHSTQFVLKTVCVCVCVCVCVWCECGVCVWWWWWCVCVWGVCVMCVCVMWESVCVCVCLRERERDRQKESGRVEICHVLCVRIYYVSFVRTCENRLYFIQGEE